MKKKLVNSLVCLIMISSLSVISAIPATAHWTTYLHTHSDKFDTIRLDPRNEGISLITYHKNYLDTSKLIVDLLEVSDSNSRADVFRVLLQIANEFKDEQFQSVVLSYKGKEKFLLEGSYFLKLGEEYGHQNPVYTARTLPENVYHLNGTQAFGTWTGGLIGVLSEQMEDHDEWWLNDKLFE